MANAKVERCIYPTIDFAVWHISPHLAIPEEGGIVTFVMATFFLGLCYGWVAYRTGSIKWTAVSHSLIGLFAFSEPLSTMVTPLGVVDLPESYKDARQV